MSDSVLIVDDDADVLRAVGDYFERLGYEVWREDSGEAALEAYAGCRCWKSCGATMPRCC